MVNMADYAGVDREELLKEAMEQNEEMKATLLTLRDENESWSAIAADVMTMRMDMADLKNQLSAKTSQLQAAQEELAEKALENDFLHETIHSPLQIEQTTDWNAVVAQKNADIGEKNAELTHQKLENETQYKQIVRLNELLKEARSGNCNNFTHAQTIEDKDKEIHRINKLFFSTTHELNNLKAQFDSMKTEGQAWVDKYNNFLPAFEELQKKLNSQVNENQQLQAQLNEVIRREQSAQELYDRIVTASHDLEIAYNAKVIEHQQLQAEHDKVLARANTQDISQEEHEKLRTEHQELQTKHDEAFVVAGRLKGEYDKSQTELKDCKTRLDDLEREHEEILPRANDYPRLQDAYQQLEEEYNTALPQANAFSELKEKYDGILPRANECESAQAQYHEIHNKYIELHTQLTQIEPTVREYPQLKARFDDLERAHTKCADYSQLQAKFDALEREHVQILPRANEYLRLQDELKNHTALKVKFEKLEWDYRKSVSSADYTTLQFKFEKLEQDYKKSLSPAEDYRELEKKYLGLIYDIGKHHALQQEFNQIKAQAEGLQEEVNNLRPRADNYDALRAMAEEQIEKLQAEVTEWKEKHEVLNQKYEKLSRVAAASAQTEQWIRDLEDNVVPAREEQIRKLEAETTALKNEVKKKSEEVEHERQNNTEVHDTNKNLQKELDKVNSELQKAGVNADALSKRLENKIYDYNNTFTDLVHANNNTKAAEAKASTEIEAANQEVERLNIRIRELESVEEELIEQTTNVSKLKDAIKEIENERPKIPFHPAEHFPGTHEAKIHATFADDLHVLSPKSPSFEISAGEDTTTPSTTFGGEDFDGSSDEETFTSVTPPLMAKTHSDEPIITGLSQDEKVSVACPERTVYRDGAVVEIEGPVTTITNIERIPFQTTTHNAFACWSMVEQNVYKIITNWFQYLIARVLSSSKKPVDASPQDHLTSGQDAAPPSASSPQTTSNITVIDFLTDEGEIHKNNGKSSSRQLFNPLANPEVETDLWSTMTAFFVHCLVYYAIFICIDTWSERSMWLAANETTRSGLHHLLSSRAAPSRGILHYIFSEWTADSIDRLMLRSIGLFGVKMQTYALPG